MVLHCSSASYLVYLELVMFSGVSFERPISKKTALWELPVRTDGIVYCSVMQQSIKVDSLLGIIVHALLRPDYPIVVRQTLCMLLVPQ